MTNDTVRPQGSSQRIATYTGVGLFQNPPYTQTWRDFSSTRTKATDYVDIFNNKTQVPANPPWITEYTLQHSDPEVGRGRRRVRRQHACWAGRCLCHARHVRQIVSASALHAAPSCDQADAAWAGAAAAADEQG